MRPLGDFTPFRPHAESEGAFAREPLVEVLAYVGQVVVTSLGSPVGRTALASHPLPWQRLAVG